MSKKKDVLYVNQPTYRMVPSVFSLEIEKIVKEQKMDYLDAVCLFCEQNEIDYETIPRLLSKTMKEKIEIAALERNFRL